MFIFAELRGNSTNLIHVYTKIEQIFIRYNAAFHPRGRDVTVFGLKIDPLISILRNDRCPTFFSKDTDYKGDD